MKNLIFLFLTINTIFACNSKKDECENAFCTEEYSMVTISITDEMGEPVFLNDSQYRTYKKNTNKEINVNADITMSGYIVFSDSNMSETSKEGEIFIFEAKRNDKIFVSEEFVIGKDCCHIKLLSGKTQVFLEI